MSTTETIPYRFLVRGGTADNLAAVNEVPLKRELVAETDTGRMKLGDGITAWNDLSYLPRVEEAPMDGRQYARQNGGWTEVVASAGGTPGDVVELSTDFMSQPATSNNGADFYSTLGASSVVEHFTLPENPGIVRLRPSSTSSAQSNITSRSAPFLLGGGEIWFESVVWIEYAMATGLGQNFRVGLWDTETGSAVWGVRFTLLPSEAQTTGWAAEVVDGGTVVTYASHNQAVTVGRKYRLGFVVAANGGSVEAFIDGVSIGAHTIANPSAYAAMFVRAQMWSPAGTTSASTHGHCVDYLRARKTLAVPR